MDSRIKVTRNANDERVVSDVRVDDVLIAYAMKPVGSPAGVSCMYFKGVSIETAALYAEALQIAVEEARKMEAEG